MTYLGVKGLYVYNLLLNVSEIITIIDKANMVQYKHLGSFCTIFVNFKSEIIKKCKIIHKTKHKQIKHTRGLKMESKNKLLIRGKFFD